MTTNDSPRIELYSGFLVNKLDRDLNQGLIKKMTNLLQKKANSKHAVTNEINTFVMAHAHLDFNLFHSIEAKRNLERQLKAEYIEQYLKKVNKRREKRLKKDLELIASKKALIRASNHLHKKEKVEFRELIKREFTKLLETLNYRFSKMLELSTFTLWEESDSDQECIVFDEKIMERTTCVDCADQYIGEMSDALTILVFGSHYLTYIEDLLVTPLQMVNNAKAMIDTYRPNLCGTSPSETHRADYANAVRVLQGKILGLRDILRVCQREIERLEMAIEEVNKEAELIFCNDIKFLASDLVSENKINNYLIKIDQLEAELTKLIPVLRTIIKETEDRPVACIDESLENRGELNLLKFILDFYIALEGIRFWTDAYSDIPSFTILKGGVAYEYAEPSDHEIPIDSVLYAQDLFKQYKLRGSTVYALRGCNIDIKKGQFVSIIGPSGSGKTTLLNVMAGLDFPDRGNIYLEGLNLRRLSDKKLSEERRDKIGFIFQFYNLLPVLTNLENVRFPGKLGSERKGLNARAQTLLEDVGLKEFTNQFPSKLSGGQMQRVTVARSLMNKPAIVFADEPTGDLDSDTGAEILKLLQEFHKQGSTIVLVTHDLDIAKYAQRILFMKDGQIREIEHQEIKELML